ncbi:5'-methylthioadenosine/S-adenosylhomocysteine nucleosidase [Adonisia turfae]|uniref:Phosphorylase n=1 Tax=Adonisia turfae CCMR0081 TaxID=2292702 RepID=A0A6M0RSD6_9CYAN|nr:5'-methylthioadenosine/S-adenosylhomocysteine nucleosidase [Adonisia turfae]NEZ58692.1 phosphorylase [Adonisia turfae CCMR0081]
MPLAVILTALPVEYLAVREHLTDLEEDTHPQGMIYERGKFVTDTQLWDVGLAQVGAGNTGAAVEAERAIAHFKPDVLLFVGIAGGIKDVKVGSVVAATKVYGYESGKVGETFSSRPEVGNSSNAIVQRATAEARKAEWVKRIIGDASTKPKGFVAPIAAGEKVIASRESELFQFLRATYNDAIAVEMEGYGFLKAAFAYPDIQTLVIRGISDLIKDKNADDPVEGNEEDRQERASQNASAFAFEILSKLEVKAPKSTKLESKPTEPASRPSFFAYDDGWVGRINLIQDLSTLIQGNCRLLMLLGITGIGKTALGERLSVEVIDWLGNDWSHYHQENFDNDQQSGDFISVAARWLEKWGELVTPDDRKDPERLMNRTISYLRENRYLVQMDSLENILQGDEEKGWNDFKDEWWLKFFTSYLKTDSCQSCFILTTQDMPGQLGKVGTRSQNFWHAQPLSGLAKTEQINLFQKIGLDISDNSESRERLEQIGQAYEGHPLALRVIGGEIKNTPFHGNVIAYWNRYGDEVQEVLDAIEEARQGNAQQGADDQWKLDRFTKTLRDNVQYRLKQTFERLKEGAKWSYILLCEASVYRCEVPETFWLSHLEDWDRDTDQQIMALDALRERYLVEQIITDNQIMLKQHNLVRGLSLQCLEKLDDDFEDF